MYNENNNNGNNDNENNNEINHYNYDPQTGEYIGDRAQNVAEISTEIPVETSTETPQEEKEETTYHFTREQLENQWQPNTGTYFTDVNSKENKKAKKAKIKKEKKGISGGKMFAACGASAMAAILASTGIMYGIYKSEIEDNYVSRSEYAATKIENTGSILSNATQTNTGSSDGEYSVKDVAQAVMPSVVSITSTAIVQSNYNPFFGGGSYQVTGAGSGIIVGKSDTELLIVTNNHVVEDTTSLTVEFNNGKTIDSAYIKGTNSSNDIAVVAIKLSELDEDTIDSIKTAVLGDSDELSVGDNVIAIGNALGYGQSVTSGVVSALNREISLDSGKIKVIQTDASINGGNSGGALVNRQGEVIGINVAKASSSGSSSATVEGMGYAIPVSEVMDIINELMNKETKLPVEEENQGYMGLTGTGYVEVDSNTSQMYNIPVGIYVRELIEGSPLETAGITAGDVITKVGGDETETYDQLKKAMQYYAVGDEVTLTVQVRGEERYTEKEFTIKLISKDDLEDMIEE